MFYVLFLVVVTTVCKFVKTIRNVHFKWVPFIVYKLFFNEVGFFKS